MFLWSRWFENDRFLKRKAISSRRINIYHHIMKSKFWIGCICRWRTRDTALISNWSSNTFFLSNLGWKENFHHSAEPTFGISSRSNIGGVFIPIHEEVCEWKMKADEIRHDEKWMRWYYKKATKEINREEKEDTSKKKRIRCLSHAKVIFFNR